MKPVELEIFLQDGLTPGLKKAGQTVSHFTNDTKRQLKDVAGALTVQRGIVRDLEKQYRDLEKSVKKIPRASYCKGILSACRTQKGTRCGESRTGRIDKAAA